MAKGFTHESTVVAETWDITPETHWVCGRPMAAYKGSYPIGFLKRLDERLGLYGKKVITLFCGSSKYGDTVDIKPEANPTIIADCRKPLPVDSNMYDVVIADPPYDSQNINYSSKLYKEGLVKPYSFVNEAVRICKPLGYICILHQLVYRKISKDVVRYAVIPITTGPNQRIRVLNVFQKSLPVSRSVGEARAGKRFAGEKSAAPSGANENLPQNTESGQLFKWQK
jgi:hypothetical protein